jgi:hypothetical protein
MARSKHEAARGCWAAAAVVLVLVAVLALGSLLRWLFMGGYESASAPAQPGAAVEQAPR